MTAGGQPTTAIRGPVLTFTGDPFQRGLEHTMVYESDAIVAFGAASSPISARPTGSLRNCRRGLPVKEYGPDALISAGFLDSHVHFPQVPMIGAFGEQLLDWLNKYTYPTERKFADKAFASSVAKVFLQECLRNGITTSCVYCTVFPQSVDALFEEAERLGMRIAAGKVLMNRNAPDYLLDTTKTGYDDSKALIGKWHGRNRLMYAITPRFAVSSTPDQLESAGALWSEFPDCLMQTHISEKPRRGRLGEGALSRSQRLSRHLRSLQAVPARRGVRSRYPSHRRRDGVHAPHGLGDRALPDLEFLSGQRLPSICVARCKRIGRCGSGSAPILAPARRSRSC